jgi:hypothetical protein
MSATTTDPMDLVDARGWLAIAMQWVDEPAWCGIQVEEPPGERVYHGYGPTLDDAISTAYAAACAGEDR